MLRGYILKILFLLLRSLLKLFLAIFWDHFLKYFWIYVRDIIKKLFLKNKHKLQDIGVICRFLAAYDVIIKNPNRKKRYMEDFHDLGLELWLAYIGLNDGPIVILMWLIIMPPAALKYMIFVFWYDMYLAFGIILSYRLYFYNLLMLPVASSTWLYKQLSNINIDWFWEYTWDYRGLLIFLKFYRFLPFYGKNFQTLRAYHKWTKKKKKAYYDPDENTFGDDQDNN